MQVSDLHSMPHNDKDSKWATDGSTQPNRWTLGSKSLKLKYSQVKHQNKQKNKNQSPKKVA